MIKGARQNVFHRVLVLVALLGAGMAGAQQVSLSVRATAGVFVGGATELSLFQGYKVSELDWPLLPVITAGAVLDLSTPVGFHAVVEFQSGFPGYAGPMTDSDFLNGDGVRTHFSQSNGFSEALVILDARLGWNLDIGDEEGPGPILYPYLEFQYLHFQWSARDGYLQYPPLTQTAPPYTPWSPSEPKTLVYGTGIVYDQDYYIPAVGLMGTIPLSKSVSLAASFSFSPYLWCNDMDDHIFRLLYFYSYMRGGVMLEPRVSMTFKLTPRMGFTVDALYRHIAQLTGDSFEVQQGVAGQTAGAGTQINYTMNGGGATLDAGSVTLSLDLAL